MSVGGGIIPQILLINLQVGIQNNKTYCSIKIILLTDKEDKLASLLFPIIDFFQTLLMSWDALM